ncbi:hypothetical protein Godav_026698 [Gossypium davidsonii]|uniref:Secreted protein n=2 Tax=Gossypium TaxID=3633 RepID=A0A7J8RUH6_GOSDV|nr:hypothetical protein [Gossypium davidsonii]MBA0652549.1 hypothetical protein [Gossypium klotzschianum]
MVICGTLSNRFVFLCCYLLTVLGVWSRGCKFNMPGMGEEMALKEIIIFCKDEVDDDRDVIICKWWYWYASLVTPHPVSVFVVNFD